MQLWDIWFIKSVQLLRTSFSLSVIQTLELFLFILIYTFPHFWLNFQHILLFQKKSFSKRQIYCHCHCHVWFSTLSIPQMITVVSKAASKLKPALGTQLYNYPRLHTQITDNPDEGCFRNMISVPFSLPVFHQLFHLWYIIILFYISGNYLVFVKWELIISWLLCILIRLYRSNKIPAIRSWRTCAAGSGRQKEHWWGTRAEPPSKSFLLCRRTKAT